MNIPPMGNCLQGENRLEFHPMEGIFERLINTKYSELAGLKLDASIPIPERLVNEIVGTAIQANKNISYCRVSISRGNRVSVNLKTPRWPWPLELQLRLEKTVELSGSPRVLARLENKVLLGRLGSFFKVFPDGVSIQGNILMVDVGAFLKTPQQKRLLDLVKSAVVGTEEGKLILDVRVEVE